ncbi:TetR/AcrR family transcriptional regulator [Paenibacillus sp. WLX2291]|uniref:TetR/AcrR family transcriptional regulator n=1 Tax=Paenibacillus sp. WLX2291 TaxID=3296934 RepID=UPI0039840B1B
MNNIKRKPGRPPSQTSRQAVFTATMALLREQGLRKMTIDKVVEQAGVSKATIYRWWSDKVEMSMEAFLHHVQIEGIIEDKGNFVDDYVGWFSKLNQFYDSPEGRILAQIIAESQSRHELLLPFQHTLQEMLVSKCMVIWERALARGEVDEQVSAQTVIELIYSPSSYRMLSNQPILDDVATTAMIRVIYNGIKKR